MPSKPAIFSSAEAAGAVEVQVNQTVDGVVATSQRRAVGGRPSDYNLVPEDDILETGRRPGISC